MNRSSKGFGLTGVAVFVLFMIVTAVFSSSANSAQSGAVPSQLNINNNTSGLSVADTE